MSRCGWPAGSHEPWPQPLPREHSASSTAPSGKCPHHLSIARLTSIGAIAIAVMVGRLITINRLWDRPVNEHLAQVVFYYNLSTVLTLTISVTGLYALLVIGILAGGLIVIDPEFMALTIHRPEARLTNYFDIG